MIVLDAEIESIATRKDRTIKISMGTQEMAPESAGHLFGLQNKLITVGLSTNGLTDEDIDALRMHKFNTDAIPNKKSQSQRMRNVLYLLYQQSAEGFDTFAQYYDSKTNQIIEHLKSKIE